MRTPFTLLLVSLLISNIAFTAALAQPTGDDAYPEGSDIVDVQLAPEEELVFLVDAEKQVATFKRAAAKYKTGLKKCDRKRAGIAKEDCYFGV